MDKNESQVEQPECGCDSTSGDDVCCAPGGSKNWRTALFVTVVVLAGAVAAHSVLTNGGKSAPCGAGGPCSIEGNGNGGDCSKTSACAIEQGNGGAEKAACCPLEKANGNGDACSKTAACPIEGNGDGCATKAACPKEGNGNGDSGCPSEKPACPKEAAAGCCPSEAPADPAPQPAPTFPTGCCPGH